jgi:hypothetical protein
MNAARRTVVRRWSAVCLSVAAAVASIAPPSLAQKVEVINNHAFPVRMPWTLHDPAGKGATVLIDVPANGRQSVDGSAAPKVEARLAVKADGDGASLSFNGKELGKLSWSVALHDVDAATAKGEAASAGKPAGFKPEPLKLSFKQSGQNNLFTTHSAEATSAGLDVRVELDVYPSGFLDVRATVTNQSAPMKGVYAAVLTHWSQPGATGRTVDYNSTVSELKDSTPWRKPGDRHQFVARGVNWVSSSFDGASVLWINAFAPSFTVHREATAKTPAQWVGANSPQLDQEAYVEGDSLVTVTELAHGSIRSYRSRLDDYVLPDKSQPLAFTHRLVFSDKPVSNEDATNAFVAYATYNAQDASTLSLGTGYVTFGTAYFPFSTLGENFGRFKLPGMSQDSYWPLAADVVKQYELFADDIRRDLRIAKSMGFQSIRLHHMEMLWTTEKNPVRLTDAERNAFLDFFFKELKHLGMTAQVDIKIPAGGIADLVKRYRPQIDSVEIDNEVLIFGIKDEDVQYWKDCYAAVKGVAPDMPVHLTGHTNTSAFKRLDALGVPYDRVGQHAYMDGLNAIPMSRDFALQVASHATRVNKPPEITEWNWRFLTRLTEEERAKVYAPIFESVFKARAVPKIYQFQFNDSLAMSPQSLKGIRHYELINLSRRPKAEAAEFQRLIDTYSDPKSGHRVLDTAYQHVTLSQGNWENPVVKVSVTNKSDRPLEVTATPEGPADLQPRLAGSEANFTLAPGQTHAAQLQVTFPKDSLPGFYHAFVRFESKDGLISYAPVELRRPGQPRFDASTHPDVAYSGGALDLDLTKPTAIVYGNDCPILELEAAWVVYQTLEAATGVRAKIFEARQLPKDDAGLANYIFVGTSKSLPRMPITLPKGQAVTRIPGSNMLVISGATSQDATLAAMDYTLRYWKTAKDAACRRVPLVEREIPKGGDAAQLP